MTKAEIIGVVADKASLTKKDAEAAIDATFGAITAALVKKDKIQISGFGTFSTKDRPERVCMNPATKQKITVKATTVPSFKAGKGLKDQVGK